MVPEIRPDDQNRLVLHFASCDVDGSGAVTVSDGVRILRAAAGLPVDLECP
jgi:hypothetical protein